MCIRDSPSTAEARCEAAEAGYILYYMTADSCSTMEAIEPSFNDGGGSLCFYVLCAFLPALLGACRHTDHGIKLPPVGLGLAIASAHASAPKCIDTP